MHGKFSDVLRVACSAKHLRQLTFGLGVARADAVLERGRNVLTAWYLESIAALADWRSKRTRNTQGMLSTSMTLWDWSATAVEPTPAGICQALPDQASKCSSDSVYPRIQAVKASISTFAALPHHTARSLTRPKLFEVLVALF